MGISEREQKLNIFLDIRDSLREKSNFIPTPSISVGSEKTLDCFSYNKGLNDSMEVIMDLIKEIANFVSVCCNSNYIQKIRKHKGGGICYSECGKCGKECECEWIINDL